MERIKAHPIFNLLGTRMRGQRYCRRDFSSEHSREKIEIHEPLTEGERYLFIRTTNRHGIVRELMFFPKKKSIKFDSVENQPEFSSAEIAENEIAVLVLNNLKIFIEECPRKNTESCKKESKIQIKPLEEIWEEIREARRIRDEEQKKYGEQKK